MQALLVAGSRVLVSGSRSQVHRRGALRCPGQRAFAGDVLAPATALQRGHASCAIRDLTRWVRLSRAGGS